MSVKLYKASVTNLVKTPQMKIKVINHKNTLLSNNIVVLCL